MLGQYISPTALEFAALRLFLFGAFLAAGIVLWRRPRPALAAGLLIGLNLVSWIAYRASIRRPYALNEGTDRAFNVGMAACLAAGASPFEHTQVRFGAPEPFWNVVIGALVFHRPERAAAVYELLTPLSLVLVGLGVFYGLRMEPSPQDGWERVLLLFAAVDLSSLSLSPDPPVPLFWAGNFLLKPNHAIGLGMVVAVVGLCSRTRTRTWLTAGLLALLPWVSLLHWAYGLVGLALGLWFRPRSDRPSRSVMIAVAASAVAVAPLLVHLARHYGPFQTHAAARHMWKDGLGLVLAVPNWTTLDLGPLLTLGLAGALALGARGAPRDRMLLGLMCGGFGLWLLSVPAALLGVAPEPDELHYFVRFVVALGAGTALAAAARWWESQRGLATGRGHLLVAGLCLPLAFPLYWDPPSMDRYYRINMSPLSPKIDAYAEWIRANTSPRAVFAGGRTSSTWIPALAGRQVLLAEAGKLLPPDLSERKEVERVLLTEYDPDRVRAAAARYGVTHVAIDPPLLDEYGVGSSAELAPSPVYRTCMVNSAVRLLEIQARPPGVTPP